MLRYKPNQRMYPGDARMRVATQQSRAQREQQKKKGKRGPGRPKKDDDGHVPNEVTLQDLRRESRGSRARLVGDLLSLRKHIETVQTSKKHPRVCVVCGENTYSDCVGRQCIFFLQRVALQAVTVL